MFCCCYVLSPICFVADMFYVLDQYVLSPICFVTDMFCHQYVLLPICFVSWHVLSPKCSFVADMFWANMFCCWYVLSLSLCRPCIILPLDLKNKHDSLCTNITTRNLMNSKWSILIFQSWTVMCEKM
jgi:hypothetical protein